MTKNKRTLTPKLRFPEFRDGPGWEERPLSDVLSEHGLKSTGAERLSSVSVHKGLVDQFEHLGHSYSASSTDHYNRVLPGDVVYTKSPTGDFPLGIIKQSKLDVPVIVSPLYGVFSPETTALGLMLDAYFESPANAKFFLEPLVQKGAKNTINIKNNRFLSGTLCLPVNKKEQQKIAESLSSLDRLIAAESRKLEALKAHKKGLMQQLFPQPGQTQPRLRFPEFRDKGEWEIRKLAEFITEKDEYPKEKLPLYSLTIENGVTPKTGRYERSFLVNNEVDAYKLVMPDDFVYNPMNLRFGAIGRHSGTEQVTVSKYYNIFSCNSTVDSRFCEIYFKSDGMVAFYDKMAIGSLIEKRRLYFSDFLEFKIRFPRLSEQRRIADCLCSLDDLISVQTQNLDSLKAHKRGLMQHLFPAPEEQ